MLAAATMKNAIFIVLALGLGLAAGCGGKVVDGGVTGSAGDGGTGAKAGASGQGGYGGYGGYGGWGGYGGGDGGSGAGGYGGYGGGYGGYGAGGGWGGEGGSMSCGFYSSNYGCNQCIYSNCQMQCFDCMMVADCATLLQCLGTCNFDDQACMQKCVNSYPGGVDAILPLLGSQGCLSQSCGYACQQGQGGSAGYGGYGGGYGGYGGGYGGSGGGYQCPVQSGLAYCDQCINNKCTTQCMACESNPECMVTLDCIMQCPPNDQGCPSQCVGKHPGGQEDIMALLAQDGCVWTQCQSECN
jgi:hypothetical protein